MPRTFAPRVSKHSSTPKPFAFAAALVFALFAALAFTPYATRTVNSQEASGRTLTLDERVRYQRAVEEVYWRHTLWPQQNGRARPSLEEVAPVGATRLKVEDVLRKSEALARVWNRPVTAAQLQAELARMARETRRPEVLRELWRALGDDPFVIAEVLARPALVERLTASYYSADERFHGALRAKAETELREHRTLDALRRAGASYSETESVKVAGKTRRVVGADAAAGDTSSQESSTEQVELSAEEWDAEAERLRALFNSQPCETCEASQTALPVGVTSGLQEDAAGFYVTSVVAATDERLKVARVDWPKTGFDAWWSQERAGFDAVTAAEDFNYELAEIVGPAAGADDTWTPTKALPVSNGATVWTGTEMIVWGGRSGARYNPATDTWTTTAAVGAPAPRGSFTAVWTGTEMIVWGGCGQASNFCGLNDGSRYNPATDTWTPTSTTNAPGPRRSHAAVWTGSKMIVWGGCWPGYNNSCSPASTRYLNTGGVYDPATDTWTATATDAAPTGGFYRAVWTGSEMLVWNGQSGHPGGRYDLATNTWRPISTVNRPSPRTGFSMIWAGAEMIVWGGSVEGYREPLNDGARYNPSNDTWTFITKVNAPSGRAGHSVVWTGTEMIVYGGDLLTDLYFPTPTNTGARYNPAADRWTQTSTAGAPVKYDQVAVWTGSEMIVWSASTSDHKAGARYSPSSDSWVPMDNNDSPESLETGVWTGVEMIVWSRTPLCISGCDSTGALYNPATYSWRPMSVAGAPYPGSRGESPTAVWSGTEMIVWGPYDGGGRYNPRTDAWARLSTTNAPAAPRANHTAVWSGTEMIVWGGNKIDYQSMDVTQNTGGRYNPATDTWTLTSTTNAPSPRYLHTATWAGGEMIVWGGVGGDGAHTNTGARYNPQTDAWTLTSTAKAPEARRYHTSVWTGTELIVWGGRTGDNNSTDGLFNTGARYNPSNDTWTATSTTGAPSPRFTHTSVWTGSLMIVWGGQSPGCYVYLCGVHTGARYNPAADAWTPVSTHRAPGARYGHLAFWTGDGMIVWGGYATEGSPQHGAIYAAPGAAPSNTPPSVRIDAPAAGATFESGADINITATATDAEGPVTAVHFYANDTLVGSDTTTPFAFNWPQVRGGSYTLTAVAADVGGAVARSQPVAVTVNPSTAPPTCAFVSPANNSTHTAPASVTIEVSSQANRDRAISTVEVFDGARSLGKMIPPPPYKFNYSGLGAGTYTFTARCTDSAGVVTNAPAVTVTVTGAPTPTPTPAPTPAPTTGPVNVALASQGGTVTVSSAYDSRFVAASLNNGDRRGLNWGTPGGGWNDATANSYPDWVEVSFSGEKAINEVDVFTVQDNFASPAEPTEAMTFAQYGVTSFEVRYWTGTAWATVQNAAAAANRGVWRRFTFPAVTTSKIRVVVTGALDGYSRLVEVEAWQGAPAPTPTPVPAAGRVNVALSSLGATAASSSQHSSNFPASAAINGDCRGLNWGSGGGWNDATGNSYPDWLEVTFAGARTIDEVGVFTLQDAFSSPAEPTEATTFTQYGVTSFEAQYWTGSGWAGLPGGQVGGNNRAWRRLTFAPVTTSKIRVVVTGALNGSSRLVEVEAWQVGGTVPTRTNHALSSNGGTASASSSYGANFPASAVNDGDRRGLNWGSGGGWNDGTGNSYPDWVEVSFGGAKAVSEVNVFTVQDAYASPSEPTEALTFTKYGVTSFDVQAWDGAQWVTVPGGAVTGNNQVWRKVTFPAVTTTKIRVVVRNALGGHSRVTEVEAY